MAPDYSFSFAMSSCLIAMLPEGFYDRVDEGSIILKKSKSARSGGVASSVAVNPRLFRQEGYDYLVGDGSRIGSKVAVRFRYVWDRAFKMVPASVQDDCS